MSNAYEERMNKTVREHFDDMIEWHKSQIEKLDSKRHSITINIGVDALDMTVREYSKRYDLTTGE